MEDDDGNRAVGTVASDAVQEHTLAGGEPYRGEAFVVNEQYMAAYDPIIDPAGEVVGMLQVGLPTAGVDTSISMFAIRLSGLLVVAMALVLVVGWLQARAVSRPLTEMSAAAKRID